MKKIEKLKNWAILFQQITTIALVLGIPDPLATEVKSSKHSRSFTRTYFLIYAILPHITCFILTNTSAILPRHTMLH